MKKTRLKKLGLNFLGLGSRIYKHNKACDIERCTHRK